jgi:hypothetical protein
MEDASRCVAVEQAALKMQPAAAIRDDQRLRRGRKEGL